MSLRTQRIKSIAEELTQEGVISSEQLVDLIGKHKNTNEDLGDILLRKCLIKETDLNRRLAKKAGVPVATPEDLSPSKETLALLKAEQVSRWQVVPVAMEDNKIILATADPFDFIVLDDIKAELGSEVSYAVASRHQIKELIETHYSSNPHVRKNHLNQQETTSSLSAVSIVDELLEQAFNEKASDVHIEPMRESVYVRFRVDGILENRPSFPLSMQQSVLSRIKILGGMDVTEHRVPQDGRFRKKINGFDLDIRIATYPTISGECAAIRLLSKENLVTLEDMGLSEQNKSTFERIIKSPHGIFLVTGPTGSGKTTTLYTGLHNIDRIANHVLTVEDPVENEIEYTSQTQVNNKAGLTFATVLRSMLREDPDVIMVGEIRDQETAEISCRAAMTGHLVVSTLHTNTAIGAISRLQDLGLQSYLISATLTGVMAQRLVRKLCQDCRIEAPISSEYLNKLGAGVGDLKNYKSIGCNTCNKRGYKGRMGLYEIIPIDDKMRVLINTNAPEIRLQEHAKIIGCKTIFEDGLEKVSKGLTSIEEVFRVCGETL